jgi:hypothetical protein
MAWQIKYRTVKIRNLIQKFICPMNKRRKREEKLFRGIKEPRFNGSVETQEQSNYGTIISIFVNYQTHE